MDASADRPPDPLAAWLAATEGAGATAPAVDDTGAPRARALRPRLILVAAVPWLAVIALGAAALGRTSTGPPPVAGVAPTVATSPVAASPVADIAATPGAPLPSGAVEDRLAAAAVLTVRLALPDEQYLDTAVAERSDELDGAVVITVAAVVLDRRDGQWSGPRHVRFAVPLSVGQSEPVALGAPWVLPTGARQEAVPAATPVDDAALATAALQTLRDAGYRDLGAPHLRRHTALPDILAVQVTARAPGEPAARDHEIWLDTTGSRVLGGTAPAPAQLPAPVPAESP